MLVLSLLSIAPGRPRPRVTLTRSLPRSIPRRGIVAIGSPVSSPVKDAPVATPTKERDTVTVPKHYPDYKVIVLNDDVNTFNHVAECLVKYIPQMTTDRAWQLTYQVHNDGQAIVWVGPLERAELYHQQLSREGLTLAPLEEA